MSALPSYHSPEIGQTICSTTPPVSDRNTDDVECQITPRLVRRWHTPPSLYLRMCLLQWYPTCWCHKSATTCGSATRRHGLDRNSCVWYKRTVILSEPRAATSGVYSFPGSLDKIYMYCSYTYGFTFRWADAKAQSGITRSIWCK